MRVVSKVSILLIQQMVELDKTKLLLRVTEGLTAMTLQRVYANTVSILRQCQMLHVVVVKVTFMV